jgi:hypothetical protein
LKYVGRSLKNEKDVIQHFKKCCNILKNIEKIVKNQTFLKNVATFLKNVGRSLQKNVN